MARFYPLTPRADAPNSELIVRTRLATLDDDWRVFPSVNWQAIRAGRQGDGEADFILLHPLHGAIVLEVKGGRIEVVSGEWFTTDRNDVKHKIKNPFVQATDSKHALLAHLRTVQPALGPIPICHAVVFPDAGVNQPIGLNPREIVLDAADLLRTGEVLRRVLDHWQQTGRCNASNKEIDRITQMLAPTLTIERRLRSDVATAERALITLTAQQAKTLDLLRSNRRCVIRGGAGTGKTLLALEKARQLARDGARVLLTCYNAPLAKWIATQCGDAGVHIATFHALCMKRAKAIGMALPPSPTDDWWEREAAEILATSADSLEERFDALIVDEAQDFSDDWLTALCLLLSSPSDSPVYVFADSHQQLYPRGNLGCQGWASAELDLNCRNTLPIAKTVALVFVDPEPKIGAQGRAPLFREATEGAVAATVQELVDDLLTDEGFKPQQVAVLSDSTNIVESIRQLVAGNHSFVPLDGVGIVTETIHRFKGLEAEVVVLVASQRILEPSPPATSLLYVGTSRGRSLLFVVGAKAIRKRLGLK